GARGGGRARGALRRAGRARRRGARPGGRRASGRRRPRTGEASLTVSSAEAVFPVALQQRVDSYLAGLSFAREPATEGLDEAMRLVVEHQPGEPDRVLAALGRLVDAAGVSGMVGGQFIDVTVTDDLDPDHLRHLHELKTGRLIAASVECVIQLGSITGPATIA